MRAYNFRLPLLKIGPCLSILDFLFDVFVYGRFGDEKVLDNLTCDC